MRIAARCFSRRLLANVVAACAVASGLAEELDVKALVEQNRRLVEQVRAQQRQIDELRSRLDRLDNAEPAGMADRTAAPSDRQIRLSAEVGLGFFSSDQDGSYPNAEFRVDDARIFLETQVWKNVYFFTGLEVTTREANDEYFHVGELYVDAEKVLGDRRHHSLSLRAGRFNIPFGEEYQERGVMANPLVTHSVADIWGIDEGLQAYGTIGPVQYNLAVQNGGHQTLRDYDSDKAITARLSFDPVPRLHLSASAMRTGDLTVAGDGYSEVWFGDAFFRALGSSATTRIFSADLVELDAAWRWSGGHLKAAAGWIDFDDDSTTGDNSRQMKYLSLEGRQNFSTNVFGAARFSTINASQGYPLAGLSNAGKYFFSPSAPLTTKLERISLGLGYRFAPPLVWKFEYSRETGRLLNGVKRPDTDLLSSLLGMRF